MHLHAVFVAFIATIVIASCVQCVPITDLYIALFWYTDRTMHDV